MEIVLRGLQFVMNIIYFFCYICVNITNRFNKVEERIPPIKNMLLTLPVNVLQQRLSNKTITSTELVMAYIERIQDVNFYINAVIEDRFEEALKEAKKADKTIRECPVGSIKDLFHKYPILGMPFTVKESCAVNGMSHTVGSLNRKYNKAKFDCEVVKNLRAAGGIPLLVSATSEYCFGIETFTLAKGRCVSPYDLQKSSGGSSGGEGALQGCGASLFGIGSDLDGSIRIPCLLNDIFGHKPTGGLLSNRGHFPNSNDTKLLEYMQIGPMTRFGSDLALLLHIMIGKNAKTMELLKPLKEKHIKIFYSFGFEGLNGFFHQSVASEIKTAISKAVRHFQEKGIPTEKAKIRHFHNSTEIAFANLALLKNLPFVMTNNNGPTRVGKYLDELFKSFLGVSKYTRGALLYDLMRIGNGFMTSKNLIKYEVEARALKNEIINLLKTNGVLFFPTFTLTSLCHDTLNSTSLNIDYCLIFNILGLPSTHIPMGLNKHGLPIGFQVIASPMNDKLCLHFAAEIEKSFGGWKPPA